MMMTVHEVSGLTGVSIRALHHYDRIGLLHPAEISESGYRLYDDTALERLQCIMLFKELQFSLKEIKEILDSPCFDRDRALDQQITLLEMKKEHLQNLIELARGIKTIGVKHMDFTAFDTRKMDEYAKQAKASWRHKKVQKLLDYISQHYYTCSKEILASLGSSYVAGGSMTQNINAAGGDGTAEFASRAIQVYCQ